MWLLETLLEEFQTTLAESKNSVTRQISFPIAEEMIKVAIGMRRSGKTYLLFQVIRDLIQKGTPKEAILYINFEDDRLLPMNEKSLAALLDSFFSLYPENHKRRCYFFLDEIQNVEEWQRVIRRFFDSKNVQIYLTGSSAKLLSKEIASSLRGRSLSIEVWPYSFYEYLAAHQIPIPEKTFGKVSLDTYGKEIQNFLSNGGFPGVQNLNETAHRETLQSYVETVIFRDVVERYRIGNIAMLKYLTQTLLKNFSSLFAINKFFNDIKSQGYPIGRDTVYNYLDYLEDTYLISTVPIFTESLRVSQITPRKIYGVDTGLIQANTFSRWDNLGRLLENLVYLDLRRQRKQIFYYQTKSGFEIDFVTQGPGNEQELIQVTWDLTDDQTREREERALAEAEKELNIKGRIIDKETYLKEFFRSISPS